MCGIVGAIGLLHTIEENVFSDLLYMDYLRGVHSLGVLHFTQKHEWEVFKSLDHPAVWLEGDHWKEISSYTNRILLGHNRQATKGVVNVENAHPFYHGSIIGVHNGTLAKQHLLPDHKKFEVDSDNIFYAIDKEGIEETWKKICGAAALVWLDTENVTLNMIRNTERPLSFVFSDFGREMFFASEQGMLLSALARRKVSINKEKGVVSLKPNRLYTFDYSKPMEYTEKDLEACKEKAYSYGTSWRTYYNNWADDDKDDLPKGTIFFEIKEIEPKVSVNATQTRIIGYSEEESCYCTAWVPINEDYEVGSWFSTEVSSTSYLKKDWMEPDTPVYVGYSKEVDFYAKGTTWLEKDKEDKDIPPSGGQICDYCGEASPVLSYRNGYWMCKDCLNIFR